METLDPLSPQLQLTAPAVAYTRSPITRGRLPAFGYPRSREPEVAYTRSPEPAVAYTRSPRTRGRPTRSCRGLQCAPTEICARAPGRQRVLKQAPQPAFSALACAHCLSSTVEVAECVLMGRAFILCGGRFCPFIL